MERQEINEDPDESFSIQTLTAGALKPSWLRVGPGDDAAVLESGLVVTVDAMVEGVHFDDAISPEELGEKLFAVNASDVAACGARPTWAVLTLSLPAPLDREWVERFRDGLEAAMRGAAVALIGGDTTGSKGGKVVSLTLAGQLVGEPLLRSGARPGDAIWVSGDLGDASAGFHLKPPPAPLARAHRRPSPPLELGPALVGVATAAMDISDGLATDLKRLCRASSCGATVHRDALPASKALLAATDGDRDTLLSHQVAFGEDYQLLFTAPWELRDEVAAIGESLSVKLTVIGRIEATNKVALDDGEWPGSWQHFGGDQ